MTQVNLRDHWVITATFVVALLATALPMPEPITFWRPAWVALVLIYWCMAAPDRIGVVTGWTAGLLLDVMTGTLLGQHALGLSIVAYLTHRVHRRVRVLPPWRQGLTIFGLVFLHQALILWSNGIRGLPVTVSAYWASPFISMLLWPWLFFLLRAVRRRYDVVRPA